MRAGRQDAVPDPSSTSRRGRGGRGLGFREPRSPDEVDPKHRGAPNEARDPAAPADLRPHLPQGLMVALK